MAKPTNIIIENNRELKREDQGLRNGEKEEFRKSEEQNVVPGKDSVAADVIPAPDESSKP